MNPKKAGLLFLVGLFCGIFTIPSTLAQGVMADKDPSSLTLIKAKTISAAPLEVALTPAVNARYGFIEGNVLGYSVSRDVKRIYLSAVNRLGVEVWREEMAWDSSFRKKRRIEVPFSIKIKDPELFPTGSQIHLGAVMVDLEGKTITSGERMVRIPPLGQNPASWTKFHFIIGSVIVLALLLLFLIYDYRKHHLPQKALLLLIGILSFAQAAFAQTELEGFIWEWDHPISGWSYDKDSSLGFETVMFAGHIYLDTPSEDPFFTSDVAEFHIAFFDPDDLATPVTTFIADSTLLGPLNDSIQNNRYFEIPIDSGLFTTVPDGHWHLQLRFRRVEDPPNTFLVSDWEEGDGFIVIDTTPPTVDFLLNGEVDPAPTATPPSVKVECNDGPNGAGCFFQEFPEFTVSGNFCDDGNICDTAGTRDFQLCDRVRNCISGQELIIDFFDPFPPTFESLLLTRNPDATDNSTGGFSSDGQDDQTLAAHNDFELTFQGLSDSDTPSGSIVIDDHACGQNDPDSVFFENNGSCDEVRVAAALSPTMRGVENRDDGTTTGGCPAGYREEPPDSNNCVRMPVCTQFFPLCFDFDVFGGEAGDTQCSPNSFPMCFTVDFGESDDEGGGGDEGDDDDEGTGTCGDGNVNTGEQCDDGNTTNGDGCSSICQSEIVGNNCSFNPVMNDEPSACFPVALSGGTTTQTAPHCGDGNVDTGEQCDDGNTTSGDGCSETCQEECSTTNFPMCLQPATLGEPGGMGGSDTSPQSSTPSSAPSPGPSSTPSCDPEHLPMCLIPAILE